MGATLSAVLMAQLHGKLPSEQWLTNEDLLTSAVFGTLKNLPHSITADLLAKARPLEGSSPPRLVPPLNWEFWPWWGTCEPVVAIEDATSLCAIEAKLDSQFGPRQLWREWTDGRERSAGKQLWLLAVTNHASFPEDEIQRQLEGREIDRSRICWLSWLEVGRLLRDPRSSDVSNGWNKDLSKVVKGWSEDLLDVFTRMDLAPFDGFCAAISEARSARTDLPWMQQSLFRGG